FTLLRPYCLALFPYTTLFRSYCGWGGTPVLMADGRTRPLSALRVGDEIYGTARTGWYRRYVKSRVLAHWSTIKPAFRTTLKDGTDRKSTRLNSSHGSISYAVF